ncbi:hypothetical protein TRICHSKD4_2861 [Roseibium sp. TrichSKD4]|nr:hypothetical protein TRICHSKD4_2861 [Roseibium sp. TrichSKD4]
MSHRAKRGRGLVAWLPTVMLASDMKQQFVPQRTGRRDFDERLAF